MSCLLGIKTHTALSMIVEVGDFERFEKAPKFASFLGLVPSEDSSDTRVNRYSITKAGNSHLRRLLVEVAQSYTRGNVGHKSVALKQRQKGNPQEVIAYADKANERLRRRFYKMTLNKGVSRDVAATAIARELACFIWGMMTEAGKVSVRGKAMAKKLPIQKTAKAPTIIPTVLTVSIDCHFFFTSCSKKISIKPRFSFQVLKFIITLQEE